eukprot:CAMPEP_0194139896 /NCGR_PEP_ID=MMETSP0152-20130528/9500_1 /TAXON_ID=1049557 /ORGANISM="Thalassiothrix antarctica, Strain L6-D1" /LENGTH=58 /DNA_ID=CAMNT_0038837901 /DNA_START=61 /DNA_END=234 /DNA_ORIENTATION=+
MTDTNRNPYNDAVDRIVNALAYNGQPIPKLCNTNSDVSSSISKGIQRNDFITTKPIIT